MKLVVIRHGQSLWNLENKFTGWTDVELSEQGINEAIESGKILKANNYNFDVLYTSKLTRAIHTANLVLKELNINEIETHRSKNLNERHYGALQGLNKKDTALKYGDEQVKIWRRSYDVRPPQINKIKNEPTGESLKDTYERVIPYYNKYIKKDLLNNKKVLIVAHGNSLRSLAKYLLKISDEDIINFEIPTGNPLIFELDNNLNVLKYYYLKK